MSLETVVDDILADARQRAEEIRAAGEEQASDIRAEAEADAADIIDEAKRSVERSIEQEREQQVSNANLEAKRMRLEARRSVLEEVRETVETRIADLDGPTREELTRALLESAATEFDDPDSVSVFGRSDDRDLIESLVADYDGFEFAGETECLGGVIVESESTRIRVNNTFDSVLADVWDDSLTEISARLFNQ